ncbi:serine protease [Actinoplanes sp. N902-109]|uniref:serine protease n=1 Tax=Actinoplanes sp. (strain N902-109) TaxID=649831 RepID=UPI00032959D1|nr:serine protease [Actinoplanes sp. N902-109]AGL18438.1 ppGpp synthetase [Actinoplanes sp. N902-109]
MSDPPSPHVVHIRSVDGGFRGSGFFVAPRIVATCAHVVEHDNQVLVCWSGPDLPGQVLVRDPPGRAGTRHYPPPDIAFIGVETLDNPAAYLEPSPLGRDVDRLFIEGFSALNPTGEVGLERRVVPIIGEADRYQLLDDKRIVPGMSGSPVVEQEGMENVRGMLKSGRLAQGNSAYMIPAWEIKRAFRVHRPVLRSHMRKLPALVRPRAGTPLHSLLNAQRDVAKRYPYRVASLTRREPPPLSSVYVEQRTRSTTARTEQPVVISPVELLHRHRNALILGGPGGGKSTLIQQLVATSAQWWLQDTGDGAEPPLGRVVAVKAAAQDLLGGGAWYDSIARAVNNDLGARLDIRLQPADFARPPSPGADWLILVDGLDEVLDRGVRRELVDVLGYRAGQYGATARFVVASRPLDEREFARLRASLTGSDRIKRLGEYDLRPFDWTAVRTFAGNWFRPAVGEQSTVDPAGFLTAISDAGLAPLVEVPLLATITAIVYEEKPGQALPIDRAGLYQMFVRVLLTLRVQRQGVRAALLAQLAPLGRPAEALGERMLEDRLACLSFLAVQFLRSGRRIRDSLPAWVAQRYRPLPLGVTAELLRDLLVDTGLVAVYGDDLVFTHRSFAEYLASLALAAEFDPQQWLEQVRETGRPDSLGLFTLAEWGAAGNDTRPVMHALMVPGEQRDYPHLRPAAEMVQDGGVLVAGDAAEIIGLTETAVREVREPEEPRGLALPQRPATPPADPVTPAVDEALRAILQRTHDPARVVRIAGDERLSVRKRVAAARALIGSEAPAEHDAGLIELLRLAYDTAMTDRDRLWALFAVVETAPRHERRHAVQRLAQYAETTHDLAVRMRALELLRRSGEAVAAAAALVRRVLDDRHPPAQRAEADLLLQLFCDEIGQQRTALTPAEDADDPFETPVWRAAGWPAVPSVTGLTMAAELSQDLAGTVGGRYLRARSVPWPDRAYWARFRVPAGHSWAAVTVLAEDVAAPARERADLLIRHARRVPARGDDVTALLTRWVFDERRPTRDRRTMLKVLLSRVDLAAARELAGNPVLPVRLRAVAAQAYGLGRDERAGAETMLAGLTGAPGATPRDKLDCLWRLLVLRVLRLVRRFG